MPERAGRAAELREPGTRHRLSKTDRGEPRTGLTWPGTGAEEPKTGPALRAMRAEELGSPLGGRDGRMAAFSGWLPFAGSHAAQIEPNNKIVRIKYERAAGDRAKARTGGHNMESKRTGHARRRSHVQIVVTPVVATGVLMGAFLAWAERPVPLCAMALLGCVVLLGLLAARRPLGGALVRFGALDRLDALVQSKKLLMVLGAALFVGVLVWVLEPAWRLWSGYACLALLTGLCGCLALWLDPYIGPPPPQGKWVEPARRVTKQASLVWAAWFMALAPVDLVHGVGGPVGEPGSAVLARVAGLHESIEREGTLTREEVRTEGEKTRATVIEDGDQTRDRLDQQDAVLAEQAEMLNRALALLEERESEPRSLSASDTAPQGPPPLSPEDRAILDNAEPFADALTRYRIAVAVGDDEAAGQLEQEVLTQRNTKRAEEDFLFERARGDRHFYAHRFDEAIPAYRAAMAVRSDDPVILNNLAIALMHGGGNADHGDSLREAESLLSLAVEIRRARHDGDHEDIATSLNNLASVWMALGRIAESEPLYRGALAMSRRLSDGDDPVVALYLNNLASALRALGRASEAEPLCQEALDMHRRVFEGDHPNLAASLNNLATVRETLGRAAEAEPMYEESMIMYRRLFPGDHPKVASSMSNLASVRETLGRAAEAEMLFRAAFAMRRRLFEGDHPHIAQSLDHLASVQSSLGRQAQAEQLSKEALAMRHRLFEGDHPEMAQSLNNLASIQWSLDRPAEAEPLFQETLAMRRRLFKGDHPDVAQSLNNLAAVQYALGRAADAEPLYAEALAMRRRLYQGDHPDTANSLNNLGFICEALGRTGRAEALFDQALAMRRRLFEGDHPEVARTLNNLAVNSTKRNRWSKALLLAEEAVEMGRRCLPKGHPDLQRWEANLTAIREQMDK